MQQETEDSLQVQAGVWSLRITSAASALFAAVASTVASVPMRDLLEDLRIMRCRHLLMEPRHLQVRGALRKPPDLL